MNKLGITKATVVYVLCPANAVTGGPEALHQLCDKINSNGGKSRMVYLDYNSEEIVDVNVPLRYRHYDIERTTKIDDSSVHVIVVPEIWPHVLKRFLNIQKCIWWLSVNYGRIQDGKALFSDPKILHLYQSQYAYDFLDNLGVENYSPLYDYLSIPVLQKRIRKSGSIVLYNPKKGFDYTRLIMEECRNDDIFFVPIQGFSRPEMLEMLKKSVVYIDFGDHPGKDRIPREAAVYSNVVITGINGSAGYFADLPIPRQYKFEIFNQSKIRELIMHSIKKHDEIIDDFQYYRKIIQTQEMEFTIQAVQLFCFHYKINNKKFVLNIRKFIFDKIEQFINGIKNSVAVNVKKNIRGHV